MITGAIGSPSSDSNAWPRASEGSETRSPRRCRHPEPGPPPPPASRSRRPRRRPPSGPPGGPAPRGGNASAARRWSLETVPVRRRAPAGRRPARTRRLLRRRRRRQATLPGAGGRTPRSGRPRAARPGSRRRTAGRSAVSRYSTTSGRISGTSATWWRIGSGSAPRRLPQPEQPPAALDDAVSRPGGTSPRVCRPCPVCPPRRCPDGAGRAALTWGVGGRRP